MKRKAVKSFVSTAVFFAVGVVALAFTPHITCGCGQYEDGSQLTHLVNSASEKLIGRTIIEKNPNPGLK